MDKKYQKDKVLKIRLPEKLYDMFKEACEKEGTTMSSAIRKSMKEIVSKNK